MRIGLTALIGLLGCTPAMADGVRAMTHGCVVQRDVFPAIAAGPPANTKFCRWVRPSDRIRVVSRSNGDGLAYIELLETNERLWVPDNQVVGPTR